MSDPKLAEEQKPASVAARSTWPQDAKTWSRFLVGLALVFLLFDALARVLKSDRGQAGIVVGAVVIAATLLVDRWVSGRSVGLRQLGFGMPAVRGLLIAGVACILLLVVIPAYIRLTQASWSLYPGWLGLLPGLFAQAGLAEESLFRGYLFRHLRQGRSFLRAAIVASGPFVLVHLALFLAMPWPIALASLILSAVISFPLAYLFEIGGNTVWGPALLHFVVQGAVKVVVIEGAASTLPIVWMLCCAVIPFVAFLYRPQHRPWSNPRTA